MTKNSAIDAAYDALEGRIGSGHDDNAKAELVRWVCEAYVRTEDALPSDEFDGEDYELPKAVEALVKQRDGERDEREAAGEALRALMVTLPRCARGCRRLATTTDGDGTYHCDPHRPPSELTVSVDLPWAKLVRDEILPVQP